MNLRRKRHVLLIPFLVLAAGCAPSAAGRDALLEMPGLPARYAELHPPDRTPAGPDNKSPAGTNAGASPAVTGEVDLARALALVLDRHPALEASAAGLLAADAARRQAGAWDNPVLAVEVEGIDPDEGGGELTATVGLPVDLFGVRSARVAEATADIRIRQARHQARRLALVNDVRRAVFGVLEAREELQARSGGLDVVLETAEAVRRAEAAGKASRLELNRWKVRAGHARADVERARTSLSTARSDLAGLWGGEDASSFEVTGTLHPEPVPLDPDSLRTLLLERHPGMVELAWEAERARRSEVRLGRQRWPQLIPEVGMKRDLESRDHTLVAGLEMTLPVVDRKGAARREARLLREAAKFERADLRRRLAAELDHLLLKIDRYGEQILVFRDEVVPAAEESYRLLQLGYERGKLGYLELLDGQTSLIETRNRKTQILIDYNRALVELEALLGVGLGNASASGPLEDAREAGKGEER